MSVDFGVVVAFDGGAALSAADRLVGSLEGVTTASKKAGTAGGAMATAAAASMAKAKADAGALAQSTALAGQGFKALGSAIAGLTTQLEREEKLLKAIKAPMADLKADSMALAALHKRGAIDAGEYAKALEKARAQAGLGGGAKDKGGGGAPKPGAAPAGAVQSLAFLPSFLKLGGEAQQKVQILGNAAGLAAAKFGVMGGAIGAGVQAFQAFAIGGPVGVAIFVLSELADKIGGVTSLLEDLGKSMADTAVGAGAFALAIPGFNNITTAIKEATIAANAAAAAAQRERTAVAEVTTATEKYAEAMAKVAGMRGTTGIGDIGAFVAARQAIADLSAERTRLVEKQGIQILTDAETKKMGELTAAIEKNAGAVKLAGDDYTVAAGVASQAVKDQEMATTALGIATKTLAQLQATDLVNSTDETKRAIVEATNAVDAMKRSMGELATGEELYGALVKARDASDQLIERLQDARQVAQGLGDTKAVDAFTKQIKDAGAAADAAAGQGKSTGISKYASYVNGLLAPTRDLAAGTVFLARAWDAGKLSARIYTDELVRQAETRARLNGETETAIKLAGDLAAQQAQINVYAKKGADLSIARVDGGADAAARTFTAPDGGITAAMGRDTDVMLTKQNSALQEHIRLVNEAKAAYAKAHAPVSAFGIALANIGDQVAGRIADGVNQLADQFALLATGGATSFKAMANSILSDLERIIAKELALAALRAGLNALTGGAGAGAGDLLGKFLGGSAKGSAGLIPGHATGGSGVFGGAGGTDSKLFASWVTPGEDYRIRTPEQRHADERRERAATKPGRTVVQNINQYDPRQMTDVIGTGRARTRSLNNIRLDGRSYNRLVRT